MPKRGQPKRLKELCIDNLVEHVDTYWLPENSQERQTLDAFHTNSNLRYLISPFYMLDNNTVDYILRSLYKRSRLNRNHLLVFVQSGLRTLDLSFIKKKSIVGQSFAYFVGRNCLNLVELNISAQVDLTPKTISYMIQSLKQLKKLDISHTKANLKVIETLASNCRKLEYLNADNCGAMYDECLNLLGSKLAKTLTQINMDNVRLSKEAIERALLTLEELRFLYAQNLVNVLADMLEAEYRSFKLTKFFIDSEVSLTDHKMQSLVQAAPELRQLNLNCVGPNSCLAYLGQFAALSELMVANTASLISFRFGGVFLDALRDSLGRQLKTLHLVHFVDVNLRSIAKHCSNLVKLNVEFLGYYQPAVDSSLHERENHLQIKTLKNLSISNTIPKLDQPPFNMGQFQIDLGGLICNGCLRSLQLCGLNELTDEFFECIFLSSPQMIGEPTRAGLVGLGEFAYESIENIDLREMNGISAKMVLDFLIERSNNLRELHLNGCKHIGRGDLKRFHNLIAAQNLDCKVFWN